MNQLHESGSVHMALRLLFIALNACDDSIVKLVEFLDQNLSQNLTIADCRSDNTDIENDRIRMLSCLSLTRSSKPFALQSYDGILKDHTQLKDMWQSHREFIGNLIVAFCQTSDCNFHGIFTGNLKKPVDDMIYSDLEQPIGTASMLHTVFINHSCTNNVLRVCVEGKILVVICRPVAQGGQLFDCYK